MRIKNYNTIIAYVDKLMDENEGLLKDIDFIVGMSRGGLIPAAHIATKLIKPLVTIYIDQKDNMFLDRKEWLHRSKVLFVDDICRSGKTLELAIHEISECLPLKLDTLTIFNVVNKDYKDKFCEPRISIPSTVDVKMPWDHDR